MNDLLQTALKGPVLAHFDKIQNIPVSLEHVRTGMDRIDGELGYGGMNYVERKTQKDITATESQMQYRKKIQPLVATLFYIGIFLCLGSASICSILELRPTPPLLGYAIIGTIILPILYCCLVLSLVINDESGKQALIFYPQVKKTMMAIRYCEYLLRAGVGFEDLEWKSAFAKMDISDEERGEMYELAQKFSERPTSFN